MDPDEHDTIGLVIITNFFILFEVRNPGGEHGSQKSNLGLDAFFLVFSSSDFQL